MEVLLSVCIISNIFESILFWLMIVSCHKEKKNREE